MADSKKMPLPFPVGAKAILRRPSQGSMTDSYGDCGARVKSPKDTYLRVYGSGHFHPDALSGIPPALPK